MKYKLCFGLSIALNVAALVTNDAPFFYASLVFITVGIALSSIKSTGG